MPDNATRIIASTTCDPQEAGSDTLYISNRIGMDSSIITIVTLLPSDTIFINKITNDLSTSGIDSIQLTNQYGCDSLVIVETVYEAPAIDITQLEVSTCLLYTSPSPRDATLSRMPSSA